MSNLNIDAKKQNTYDAIVIGSGMSGGWAAKELCDKGLKTLVLERGREVRHVVDYPTTNMNPWEFKYAGERNQKLREENPVADSTYAFNEDSNHFFVKDKEHPYIQEQPFEWIRGYQTGGKSLMWARWTQRWSQYDFDGPARDGFAVEWPLSYEELAPWYSHVEKFAGISGSIENLPALPDGEFLPPLELSCVEKHFKDHLAANYEHRHLIAPRCAHITGNYEYYAQQGRTPCMKRDLCTRGCPFGAYFSSNSSTLPWAARTGNLTMRHHSVVHSIIYDEQLGKATGVNVIDAETKEMVEYYAPIIFVNGSTLNTNLILLNSKSGRFPAGLGNDNGLLGKYIAFHNFSARVYATYDGYPDVTTIGRRPSGAYVPRFRNLFQQDNVDFIRGYASGLTATRHAYPDTSGSGQSLKEQVLNPQYGPWGIRTWMMGETIPKEHSTVTLDPEQTDEWGIPLIRINVAYDDNDQKMVKDFLNEFSNMFEDAGFQDIEQEHFDRAPGNDIHEMGGARMGSDPKTSLVDKYHRLHHCQNVYITDGACMTSTSTQNPSLTYMALTARAVHHATSKIS